MKRRSLLTASGLIFCTPLTGCLSRGSTTDSTDSSESPNNETDSSESWNEPSSPPEECDQAIPGLELPNESILNEDDIGGYVKRVQKLRYLNQSNYPESTTVQLSVRSVTAHDEGFVVDVYGWGSVEYPDNKLTVSIRRTAPENVTVASADTAPFATIERLQETIGNARDKLADERCEGRVAAHLSQDEFETVRAAFEDMNSDWEGFYYLRDDVCYIGVKFDESTVVVSLFHDVPSGVTAESVSADQFDIPRLQEAIKQARSVSESADVSVSTYITESSDDRLKTAFAEMDPDEDGFYYLKDNGSYAVVNVQQEEGPVAHFGDEVTRYYADEMQVRAARREIIGDDRIEYGDPTEGTIIVC